MPSENDMHVSCKRSRSSDTAEWQRSLKVSASPNTDTLGITTTSVMYSSLDDLEFHVLQVSVVDVSIVQQRLNLLTCNPDEERNCTLGTTVPWPHVQSLARRYLVVTEYKVNEKHSMYRWWSRRPCLYVHVLVLQSDWLSRTLHECSLYFVDVETHLWRYGSHVNTMDWPYGSKIDPFAADDNFSSMSCPSRLGNLLVSLSCLSWTSLDFCSFWNPRNFFSIQDVSVCLYLTWLDLCVIVTHGLPHLIGQWESAFSNRPS